VSHEALAGFGDPVVILIAAIFIVGEAVVNAIECLLKALRVAADYADAVFNHALLLQEKINTRTPQITGAAVSPAIANRKARGASSLWWPLVHKTSASPTRAPARLKSPGTRRLLRMQARILYSAVEPEKIQDLRQFRK